MNYPHPHLTPLADALGLRSRTLGADWGVPTWVLSEVSHGGVYLCDDEQDNGTGDVIVRMHSEDGNDLVVPIASGSPDDLFDTISDYLTEDQITTYRAHLLCPGNERDVLRNERDVLATKLAHAERENAHLRERREHHKNVVKSMVHERRRFISTMARQCRELRDLQSTDDTNRSFSTEDNDCGRCGADWRNCTCGDDNV
tara:strand:+ start:206 stop:805 length:600 start_codon:yes stop_codon:yes gene_type:complete